MNTIRMVFDTCFLGATAVLGVLHALPEPVSQEIGKRYAEMEVVEVDEDHEDGQLVYEVTLRNKTRKVEADFSADGKFIKSEEEMPLASVPKAVQSAFSAAYPDTSPVEITCYTRRHLDKDVVSYVFEFYAGGREREMGIGSDGKVLFDRID